MAKARSARQKAKDERSRQSKIDAAAHHLAPRAVQRGDQYYHRSKPGEFLHLDKGHLRRNMLREVDRIALKARVGTNVLYARLWELNKDTRRRRKLLRATWLQQQQAMVRIIGTGRII